MRLKHSLRDPQEEDEECYLLQNSNLNKQGEKITFQQNTGQKITSENIRIHQGWRAFHSSSLQQRHSSTTNKAPRGYNPSLASPIEDSSNQAMSLSSPEDQAEDDDEEEEEEDENLSDLEYSEVSPLLGIPKVKRVFPVDDDYDIASDDCNNNNNNNSSCSSADLDDSEDSMFSDFSDMDQTKESFMLENNYNNNILENERYKASKTNSSPILRTTATDTIITQDITKDTQPLQKPNLPDVLPLEVTTIPQGIKSPDVNDVSPMSDSNSPLDTDINIASKMFNNFSMASSKHSDIQCLISDDANIRDNIIEKKILNTEEGLPKNMTKEYQNHLKCKSDSPWTNANITASSWREEWRAMQKDSTAGRSNIHEILGLTKREDRQRIDKEKASSSNIQELLKIMDSPYSSKASSKSGENQSRDVPELGGAINMAYVKPLNVLDNKDLSRDKIKAGVQMDENCNNNSGTCTFAVRKLEDQKSTSLCARTCAGKNSSGITPENMGDFDVYNIETAMPTIDWVAMEAHLTRAAKEDDWLLRRRNDREEIRRKLAMDSDNEEYYCGERVTRKPSLTTRLQSSMNLQICFMNETASDQESQGSDQDTGDRRNDNVPEQQDVDNNIQDNAKLDIQSKLDEALSSTPEAAVDNNNGDDNCNSSSNSINSDVSSAKRQRPSFFFNRQRSWRLGQLRNSQDKKEDKRDEPEEDFYTRHARLQAEARLALAQAKEMARMQMEVERQRKKKSPIADIVGLPFPDGRNRLSRQVMTEMNVAQLQVIVNDLHSQIESLNEDLVRFLLERDDLHMEQDSMLVDIEDLTRYLGAKDEAIRNNPQPAITQKPKNLRK